MDRGNSPAIGAVVLAAGRSTRMGVPKALLPYRGRPFLTRVIEELRAAGASPVIVVGPPDPSPLAGAIPPGSATLVGNPDRDRGQISSLRRGMSELPDTAAAFLACPVDCPTVASATVRRLIEAFAETGGPIVLPVHAGRRGHPALFGRAVFLELATCPEEGGARNVISRDPARVHLIEVDDPGVLVDVDTPEDYRRLE